MILTYKIINVFTDKEQEFSGNPAACFLLKKPLTDAQMQQIATKVKQPASVFLWPGEEEMQYHVRWYAVDAEIKLCGHGAAAAAVFLGQGLKSFEPVTLLHSQGSLRVQLQREGDFIIELEGIHLIKEIEVPASIEEGLGIPVLGMYETDGKHIILVESEQLIQEMTPDFEKLRDSNIFGYAITAPGKKVDFVSRTLVPHVHQLEDHATGSSHAALVPFWAEKLKNDEMTAWQLSENGGKFHCKWREERNKVYLQGNYRVKETCTVEL